MAILKQAKGAALFRVRHVENQQEQAHTTPGLQITHDFPDGKVR